MCLFSIAFQLGAFARVFQLDPWCLYFFTTERGARDSFSMSIRYAMSIEKALAKDRSQPS